MGYETGVDLSALFEPLTAPYLRRALVELLVLAVPAGLLGAWVVVRRQAFVVHGMGHATFPAVVIASLAGWPALPVSVAAAILLAAVVALLMRRPQVSHSAAVAVVLSASLAIGAVLVSDIRDPGVSANTLLFGSIFATTWADAVISAAIGVAALGVVVIGYRGLTLAGFDADRRGTGAADLVLLVVLAIAVALAARIVGSLLVAALFLIPSATARQVTRRMPTLMLSGVAIAAFDGIAGLWLAVRMDTPPGASIAAFAAAVFVLVVTARSARSLYMRTVPT